MRRLRAVKDCYTYKPEDYKVVEYVPDTVPSPKVTLHRATEVFSTTDEQAVTLINMGLAKEE
jgi:hypothetical protein